tara:strand:- start:2427 stop:2852 length:426 start_codon:yes stop_codon:yes gene_type:complete
MSSNFYSVGLHHVGAYQVSGIPYVSGSSIPATQDESFRFQFQNVTKKIIVKSTSNDSVRMHFAPFDLIVGPTFDFTQGATTNDNFFVILAGAQVEFELKCKEVFFSPVANSQTGEIQVYAELTNIPASRMFDLEGLEGITQ